MKGSQRVGRESATHALPWWRQLLHVARKDIRVSFWPLLVYAAILVLATVSALMGVDVGFGSLGWSVLLVITGMAVAATLVQSDSPARGDAFWVSLPLRPSAVFAAKALNVIVLLCGLGLLAQTLALRAHTVAPGDYLPLLVQSALAYGLFLGVAAVLASLTRSFRSLFVISVVLVISLQILGGLVMAAAAGAPADPTLQPLSPRFLTAATLAALAAVLAYQYRTRRVGRSAFLAAGVLLVSWFLTAAAGPISPAAVAHPVAADMQLPLAGRVDVTDRGPWGWHLRVELLPAVLPAGLRYRLLEPAITLINPDGTPERLKVLSLAPVPAGSYPYLPAGLRWLHEEELLRPATLHASISSEQADLLRTGAASVVASGIMDVQEEHGSVLIPLRSGTFVTGDGIRGRVVNTTLRKPDLDIEGELSLVAPRSRVRWRHHGRFASEEAALLVNPRRDEAYPLMVRASSGNPLALVLPGPRTVLGRRTLARAPTSQGHHLPPPDAAWLEGAALRVSQWRPIGLYLVEVEAR